MWHSMFSPELPYLEKILRTVIVYALVAVLIRLAGKRSLAGLNTLDFVVMFLLSNVVQNAIIGPDNSVTGAAVGAATLVLVNATINRLVMRSPSAKVQWLFNGRESQVIKDGRLQKKELDRLGITDTELERAVHLQNADDMHQIDDGTVFPGGELVLRLRPSEQGATKGDVDMLRSQLSRIERALGLDTADAT